MTADHRHRTGAREPHDRRAQPRRTRPAAERAMLGLVAWLVGILFVLPVLWMLLTSFHTEAGRSHQPAALVGAADPARLPGVLRCRQRRQPLAAAAQLADGQRRCRRCWCWCWPSPRPTRCPSGRSGSGPTCCSSSCPPRCCRSVAGLLPIYLFAKNAGLLDNIWLLIVLYTSMNLPIAVWMMRSFLAEVPVGDPGGRRRSTAPGCSRILRADRRARSSLPGHRRDLADLLHLQLERAAVRPGAHRRPSRRPRRCSSPASSPARACSWPRCAPRRSSCLAAGARRRVRRPGQARPGPVPRRRQMRAVK